MRKLWKHVKNQKGLTLVELLAVIVILGIIAAIAVPAIGNIIENSRKDAHVANAESLYNAARLAVVAENISVGADEWTFYAVEPDTDTDTAKNSERINLIGDGYLDETPQDPQGDGAYDTAQVTYDGEEYKIILDSYFTEIGKDINTIRSGGRSEVAE